MKQENLYLSIVLQVGGQRERSVRCLASLLAQDAIEQCEIILMDYAVESQTPLQGSHHSAVRTMACPNYEPIGESRARAVREARGAVIAFIEDHCIAHPGWAKGIIGQHRGGQVAIGAEVHIGNRGMGISDAIGVMNYLRWLPPARNGSYDLLVGHNTAYDKGLLLGFGECLGEMLRCDPVLQWKLREGGHDLFLDAAIKISHTNETELLPIIRGYFLWNRIFAPTRAKVFRWTLARRIIWIALSPLIPAVRMFKQMISILRVRPDLMGLFITSIPVQVIALSAAASGQALGLLAGPGNAETAFLHYELNQARREFDKLSR